MKITQVRLGCISVPLRTVTVEDASVECMIGCMLEAKVTLPALASVASNPAASLTSTKRKGVIL